MDYVFEVYHPYTSRRRLARLHEGREREIRDCLSPDKIYSRELDAADRAEAVKNAKLSAVTFGAIYQDNL